VAIAVGVVATGEVDVANHVEVRVAVDTGVYDVGVDVRYGTRAVGTSPNMSCASFGEIG
jgi:hypothetical protein